MQDRWPTNTQSLAGSLRRALRMLKPAACACGLLLATACSHAPTQKEPAPATEAPQELTASAPEPTPLSAELDDAAFLAEPVEPQSAEEAVALAKAEQNLLNRIRTGFAMQDADHVRVDREIAWFIRHPDYLDRTFRRAERYLYYIVQELEARKMPMELALLPLVESAFNPVAKSRARAVGLWQFIPSTGRRYGLEQNHSYDGRRDIVESTRAALDYLQFLANEFDGDWQQAVAAYNCGEMNVARAVTRNRAKDRPTDFFSLDLPRETRSYVPKLLAIRRIVAEPAKYGLEFGHMANEPYFATVEIDAPVDLGVAAALAGLPKEDLIALNPAYPRAVATQSGPGHILVPSDRAEQLRDGLAKLSPAQRAPKIYYTVRRNDTLSTVAKKLGVSVDELKAANRLKSNVLRVGQELVIERGAAPSFLRAIDSADAELPRMVKQDPSYVPPPIPPLARHTQANVEWHRVRSGETLWAIAKKYGVNIEKLADYNDLGTRTRLRKGQRIAIPPRNSENDAQAATLAANDARGDVERITYVVSAGDTLGNIAAKFRVEVNQLLKWNRLKSANLIKVGQKLVMYVADNRRAGG